MYRRYFLAAAGSLAVASSLRAETFDKKLRIAVIGHTGRGNYGHGLDTVWLDLPETEIVGVADANADGLKAALQKLKVEAGIADYREMLSAVKPDITAVCPRYVDEHADMVLAAV